MHRYLDSAVWNPLLRWLRQPLIGGWPWTRRLRHYAVFLLLIALGSPISHGYLDVSLSPGETIVHTALVAAAAGVAILLVEALIAGFVAGTGGMSVAQPVTTGGFLARAVIAYMLSAPFVGFIHGISPYTETIMAKHAAAGQATTAWSLVPVALLIVYLAYLVLRKDYLAGQVAALRRINDELDAAQRQRREASTDEAGRGGRARDDVDVGRGGAAIRVDASGVEVPLPSESIIRIEADENYCHVVPATAIAAGKARSHLVRITLKEALDAVPERWFLQTHRSHIVNLRYVAELCRDGRRRELRLSNGDRVPVSRSRARAVESRIRDFLTADGGASLQSASG